MQDKIKVSQTVSKNKLSENILEIFWCTVLLLCISLKFRSRGIHKSVSAKTNAGTRNMFSIIV